MDEEDIDLDVVGTTIENDNSAIIADSDTISIEQIAELFGVQETLGCGASFSEYSEWYNSLGIVTIEAVNLESMYNEYVNICEADGTYYIPPNADTPKEKTLKGLALVGGAVLLYSTLKK